MLRLDRDQHQKVLGFALLGYGISTILSNVSAAWVWGNNAQGMGRSLGTETAFLFPLLIIFASIWSSQIILSSEIRQALNLNSVFGSIVFVFVAITSFPVGTLLSGYLLLYIFKIADDAQADTVAAVDQSQTAVEIEKQNNE